MCGFLPTTPEPPKHTPFLFLQFFVLRSKTLSTWLLEKQMPPHPMSEKEIWRWGGPGDHMCLHIVACGIKSLGNTGAPASGV